MITFEAFEQALQTGLNQLYSLTYRPPTLLWQGMDQDPRQGITGLQRLLVQAIAALKPAPTVPPDARSWRLFEVLQLRYIEGLTQKDTAQRLGISPRHLRREQQRAVHALARHLWDKGRQVEAAAATAPRPSQPSSTTDDAIGDADDAPDRRTQIRRELAALEQSAPGVQADVDTVLSTAVKSGKLLAARHQIDVSIQAEQTNLMVTMHPAVLREVLITTIDKLVHVMSGGEITFAVRRQRDQIVFTITGYPVSATQPPHSDFIREAVRAREGLASSQLNERSLVYTIALPAAGKIRVAVVEDNADLVHFYRRYTAGTRYEIIHIHSRRDILPAIIEVEPDLILLDILLPEVDGWELLSRLHEHPATQAKPVIVCSVVRREEMSLAYGAARYLQKPVRLEQFLAALDQVLAQTATTAKLP